MIFTQDQDGFIPFRNNLTSNEVPQILIDLPLIHSFQIAVAILGLQFLERFVTTSQELANVSCTFMANNVKGKRSVAEINLHVYNKVV